MIRGWSLGFPRQNPHNFRMNTIVFSLALLLGPAETARPNLIIVHVDDLRYDTLGYLGNPVVQTPNLDKLARKGTSFTNSFVTTSICGVSRATLLTGQWQRRHKCAGFNQNLTDDQWKRTYPEVLRQTGYRTGFIGKIGIADKADQKPMWEKRWDFYRGLPGQGGDEFIDSKDPQKPHKTQIFGDQALEFVSAKDPKPFVLQISFNAVHARDGKPREFTPDPRDEELYKDTAMPVPPLANEEAYGLLPKFVQDSEARKRWKPRYSTPEMAQATLRDYYRLVTGVDREVGRIVEELQKRDLAKNTVLVFTSDNGFALGDRGLADKWFMYEESIRVPLLIADLREKDASRCRVESIVLNADIAPTLLDLAGAKIPKEMQGQSLVPFLKRYIPMDWRQGFFYEHHAGMKNIPPSEGVRSERFKYIRWLDPTPEGIKEGHARAEQLFELDSDPLEKKDLAADPKYAQILDQSRKVWQYQRKELE